MWKRYLWCVCAVTVLALGSGVQAGEFSDDFEAFSMYVGPAGDLGAYSGVLDANSIVALDTVHQFGALYIESNGSWAPGPGPMLYIDVPNDFVATVKVVGYAGTPPEDPISYNNCGLVVRAADGQAGDGEDWLSIDYFPLYNVGNIARWANDGARDEDAGGNGTGWNADPWLQIEKIGDEFYLRTSPDGETWIDYPGFSPVVRPDLNGQILQVGLAQATFSENIGWAAFDDFSVVWNDEVPLVPTPAPAPTHSYTFEDGTAADVIAGADGNLVGGAEVVNGALLTTAQDQWMEMPGDVIDINSYSAATIECWYTPEAGANTSWSMLAYLGASDAGLGNDGWFITTARGDDRSRAAISCGNVNAPYNSETGVNGPEYDDGILHHMVSTIDANNITLYIDGELMGTAALTGDNSLANLSNNLAYLAKGGYGGDPEWIGQIQEFNIYNEALTEGQVLSQYQLGPAAAPVHAWLFEDGTANDAAGIADGNLVGGAQVIGGALVTTAQDQWMEMPGDAIDINSYDAATIEVWYVPEAGANASWSMLAYFGASDAGLGNDGWFITTARGDDRSRAAISCGNVNAPYNSENGVNGPEYDDGLLHHMVSTLDANNITLYIDGELMGVAALTGDNSIANLSNNLAYLAKGGYGGDPEWIGAILEAKLYNVALTASRVAENYAAGPVVTPASVTITDEAPVPGELDIANLMGCLTDANNVGDGTGAPYGNDATTYVAMDRGGQGQTFVTGDTDVVMTGVWVKHVTYTGGGDQTWYRMQPGGELQIRVTDPNAAGTDAFVLASESYVFSGDEENALPSGTTNTQTGTGLWFHIELAYPVALAANTEYGFDLTSLSSADGTFFFELDGIRDGATGGNPYEAGSAYVTGSGGQADNDMTVAPGDRVFVVELNVP